ncbi:MAG: transketolase [Cetobacterium sp.]
MEKDCKDLRVAVLKMINKAGSGHPGGSLSAVELLYVLYKKILRFDIKNIQDINRDRVIISKGHCSPIVYCILNKFGFFSKNELEKFREYGALLQGHVSKNIPGIELSTGSLGMGLGVSCGMALAGKLREIKYNVYCLIGDGELQEGSNWESLMFASHHKLTNLCIILDYNKVQENGFVNNINNIEPLKEKLESFGWKVIEIDGHNIIEIEEAYNKFLNEKEKPTIIIGNTIKGKGVSFMEFNNKWHGKAPNENELAKAILELEEK